MQKTKILDKQNSPKAVDINGFPMGIKRLLFSIPNYAGIAGLCVFLIVLMIAFVGKTLLLAIAKLFQFDSAFIQEVLTIEVTRFGLYAGVIALGIVYFTLIIYWFSFSQNRSQFNRALFWLAILAISIEIIFYAYS